MIKFYRDSYGVTVYFGVERENGSVIVNDDIEMRLDQSMTFGEEKIVKVQSQITQTTVVGYTDGSSTVLPSEFQAWLDGIKNDANIGAVEKDVRTEVLKRTWQEKKENKEVLVDCPFNVTPLQNTEDYRLIPVRCSRSKDKPVYFVIRAREEWLYPHVHNLMKRFGLKKTDKNWGMDKDEYNFDKNGLTIGGTSLFNDTERQEILSLQFTGTVEECQKRINDIIDLVEDKVNLWWKVKQRTDGITVGEILSFLKHLRDKVATLDVKKNDSNEKTAVLSMIEDRQRKMVEYAKSIPNPTPEQIHASVS